MTTTKICFKCLRLLSLDEFYAHPEMGDGHLNKCKECTKADVKRHYQENIESVHRYERERNSDPQRKEKRLEYQRNSRKKNRHKWIARQRVKRAIESGRLIKPERCSCCNEIKSLEAHHTDYSRPLDVQWMCFVCHREIGHGQKVSA